MGLLEFEAGQDQARIQRQALDQLNVFSGLGGASMCRLSVGQVQHTRATTTDCSVSIVKKAKSFNSFIEELQAETDEWLGDSWN